MYSDGNHEILAGAGRTDITPSPDCILAGFAAREHEATGIHDNLTATALALSRHGETAVIVGLDLISISQEHLDSIRETLGAAYGLKPGRLLINCSHTHAGPVTEMYKYTFRMPDGKAYQGEPGYLATLEQSILKAITTALDTMEPVQAFSGIGETHIGISRRSPDAAVYRGPASGDFGFYANYPNPRRKIDRTCPVIMFKNMSGDPFALIFGAPCHPTTMSYDNYLVSAEYPGVARRIIEKRLKGATSLFLQGIGGDVKPGRVALETRFRSGSFEDVAAVGSELADDVIRTIERGLSPMDCTLRSSLKRVPFPLDEGWNEAVYRDLVSDRQPEHRRRWAQMWLDTFERGKSIPRAVNLTLALMELSHDIRFASVSGELLTDMGLKIKRHLNDGMTLPLGYTNGVTAYIPDSGVLEEGGYEAVESMFFCSTMPAPWRKDIDTTMLRSFDELSDTLE